MTPIHLPHPWPFPVIITNGKALRVVPPPPPPPPPLPPPEEAPF